jgi:hypothetical protein
MRIEAELDLLHSERLKTLQVRLNKPLPEVLAIAIDAALGEVPGEPEPGNSTLYDALDAIGFIGCIATDEKLSADYKQHLNFSAKTGAAQ